MDTSVFRGERRKLGQEAVLVIQVRAAPGSGREGEAGQMWRGMLRRYTGRGRGPGILLCLPGDGKLRRKLDYWGRQACKTLVDITRATQMPLQ